MPRPARGKILYDGCYAHVFSRSIETRRIFQHPNDFEHFKKLLLYHKRKYAFRIHHYCLMHTHFHLAVSMPDWAAFSEALKGIKWKYTMTYNKRYERRGPLWQERFKSLLIEDERYLALCGIYIENNPVKAEMVRRAMEWPYSSARYYGEGKSDRLVDRYGEIKPVEGTFTDEFFTKGNGIGSDLFRIHIRDELVSNVPVP